MRGPCDTGRSAWRRQKGGSGECYVGLGCHSLGAIPVPRGFSSPHPCVQPACLLGQLQGPSSYNSVPLRSIRSLCLQPPPWGCRVGVMGSRGRETWVGQEQLANSYSDFEEVQVFSIIIKIFDGVFWRAKGLKFVEVELLNIFLWIIIFVSNLRMFCWTQSHTDFLPTFSFLSFIVLALHWSILSILS